MKTRIITVIIVLVSIPMLFFIYQNSQKNQAELNLQKFNQKYMRLFSPVFNDNETVPSKYTCDGEDVSPPLAIEDAPENAKSLALIVDDPDAPRGDFVHWLVFNIPPDTAQIAENSAPNGAIQGSTDFSKSSWGGPCPPAGAHRYQFKLYALDIELPLNSSARKSDVEAAIANHILDRAMLIGLYQRQ